MTERYWQAALAAAAMSALCAGAQAGPVGRDAQTLVFTPAAGLAMESETIAITAETIAATYVLKNTGTAEAASDVSIWLVRTAYFGPTKGADNCRNDIALTVTVDGAPLTPKIESVATDFEEQDVTSDLAALGLDLQAPDSCDLTKLDVKTLEAMQKAGLIEFTAEGGKVTEVTQMWIETTMISWRQAVPAGGSATIATTETAFLSAPADSAETACVYEGQPDPARAMTGLNYYLNFPSGDEPLMTIGRFKLTLDAGAGINRSCYAGAADAPAGMTQLKAESASVLSLELSDTTPQGPVSVQFEQPAP